MELPLDSLGVNRNILNCTLLDSRNIRQKNSWIGNPRVNEGIFSPSCDLKKTSSLQICTGSIDLLDTSINGSTTLERNLKFSCIEKLGVKSILGEIVPDLDPSKQVNLANSVLRECPKFKSLRLPAVDATDIHNTNFVSSNRANSLIGTQKDNVSPSRLGYTHDFETMRKTTAYRNHINNSEFETREIFEQETETIPLTLQTNLMTTLQNNPLTRSTDSSKHEKMHEPEVNPDPETSSSDSSKTSSSN